MSNTSVLKRETVWDMLNTIERGEFVLDIEQACQGVVQSVQETGKQGSITLTITFRPDAQLGAIRVGGKLAVRAPQKAVREALFFPTPEGNLSRYDAKQRDMFRVGSDVPPQPYKED